MSETYQPVVPDKASGMAIAVLVCGILAFCCCPIIGGITALILGFIENGKIKKGESSPKGKGFVIAGAVLALVALLKDCIVTGIYLMYGAAAFTHALHQMH